jgi:hypothetical protein
MLYIHMLYVLLRFPACPPLLREYAGEETVGGEKGDLRWRGL